MHNHLKLKIFVPLAVTLIFLLLSAIIGFSQHINDHVQHKVHEDTERLIQLFKYSIDQDAQTILGLSDFVAKQSCLQNAWIKQQRQVLLDCSTALFKQLRKDYRITHFYFHSLDKRNFLRVHNPKRHGDLIERFTLKGAIQSKKPFYGIEMGPYGTFTLRAVTPWLINGQLVGYLELGEEIEHLTKKISVLTGIELLLLADKQLLNKDKWHEGLKMMERQGDWNLFSDVVVIDKSTHINLSNLKPYIASELKKKSSSIIKVLQNNHVYNIKIVPLYDSNQQKVGQLIAQIDFTQEIQETNKLIQYLTILFILLGGLLITAFWFYLQKIENFIEHTQDKLREKVIMLNDSRKKTIAMMEEAVAARQQAENLNHDLIEARIRAESANEAKSQFLSTMSHELRTPMNGMLGMTELLTDTPLNTEQTEYLKIINQSGQSLLGIINDILDFSKIEVGKMQLDPISFDLEYTINDVISLLTPKAEEKNLLLLIDYTPDCPRQLIGDVGRLRQILVNLLGNAIKFTSSGHIITRVKCEQNSAEQVLLHLQVEDSGIGIDSHKVDKLFESFSQVDASTTRKLGGTGLGLAISKKLIELMQGEIGVSSVEGKGSTFWFKVSLPISPGIEILPVQELNNVRILIVDDIEVNRDILMAQLQSFGISSEAVASPSSAIKKLLQAQENKQPFDIAILDYNMPELDGVELAKLIQNYPSLKQLKLLLLTSSSTKIQTKHYKQIGFSAYLCKPVHSDLLRKTLTTLLAIDPSNQSCPLITRHMIAEMEYKQQQDETPSDSLSFSGKVLLAEDVKVNQMLATKILTKFGLQVDIANNGEEAVKMSRQIDYDLIFMDCQMPVKDGYEATQEIRLQEQNTARHIPIIALTANAMKEDREYCIQQGMDDFIPKPFKANDLRTALKHWLKPNPNN